MYVTPLLLFFKGEKLDQVLGHVQKNFEGEAFTENLGKSPILNVGQTEALVLWL